MTSNGYTYVFAVPHTGLLKIGSTNNIKRRAYQLRWGSVSKNAPTDSNLGDIVCVAAFRSMETARGCERSVQHRLRRHRVGNTGRNRGGRSEWFKVQSAIAVNAMMAAAKETNELYVINNLVGCSLFDLT